MAILQPWAQKLAEECTDDEYQAFLRGLNTYGKEKRRQEKWDQRFLEMAKMIASWSKDPSTQVGAVIVDSKNRIVSLGFNGMPIKVHDLEGRLENRETKLKLTIHAEKNAVLFARGQQAGCTIYVWPMPPCASCAAFLVQAGITRIVSIEPSAALTWRWGDDMELAKQLYDEADVLLDIYPQK